MRQLIKFCIVGASSTVIDKGIFVVLRALFPLVPWWIMQTISFCFGVSNGFYWNQRWTFRAHQSGVTRAQYSKFFVTNVVGLGLNLLITKGFLVLFTGQVVHNVNPDTRINVIASLCAVPIVVVWNFSASRFWTFRAPKAPQSAPTESNLPPIAAP